MKGEARHPSQVPSAGVCVCPRMCAAGREEGRQAGRNKGGTKVFPPGRRKGKGRQRKSVHVQEEVSKYIGV